MLYVKVDAAGNPVEVAKNYREISEEHLSKGSIFPSESVLSSDPASLGYAEVPDSKPLPPKAGSKVVPDVPTKNGDGTMTRTWKYEAATQKDIDNISSEMKARRSILLRNLVDTISPVRWNSWTAEEQAEVTAWRQSLLDLPTAEGWPYVTFPELPQVLKK